MGILRLLVRCLLWSWGWSIPSAADMKVLGSAKRCLIVYSHTTCFELIFGYLYLFIHPRECRGVHFLAKRTLFDIAILGPILRLYGGIPTTLLEDKGQGLVQRIVSSHQRDPEFQLYLSPKGMRKKNEWRTGYYAIAREMDLGILVMALDYEQRSLMCAERMYSTDIPEASLRPLLMRDMGRAIPLYPGDEVVALRYHDPARVGVVAWSYLLYHLALWWVVIWRVMPEMLWLLMVVSGITYIMAEQRGWIAKC